MVGVRHVEPSQHPCAQVVALQVDVVTHAPEVQVVPAPQATQAAPAVPQAVFCVPWRQTPFWQHPVGHVVTSHACEQRWFTQVVAQVAQATPAVPHALAAVPARHTPPWQHPVGHVWALQVPWHTPASEHDPTPHDSHATPPEPQAVALRPVTQVEPEQHPVGQVVALHVAAPHWPPLHGVAPQSRQARPPVPHAIDEGLVTHWFPTQHPAHEAGVH
jgi:hypothetical protein